MTSAQDVVEMLAALIALEAKGAQLTDPGTGVVTGPARARLAEALDAWRNQVPWPTHRCSAFDRARRDPVFNSLVRTLHGVMAQGEGQYTPTEVREAAMVAQVILERDQAPIFQITLPPGLEPTPLDVATPEEPDRKIQ